MPQLNYHHLRYFLAIANEGSLSSAARRLNVAPSSLSVQLKALEQQLGQQLFERRNKELHLTEAGRIALDYAGTVFRSGHEMIETLGGLSAGRQILRIGAVATLSRNFQLGLMKPLISREDVELIVHSGALPDLLGQLDAHKLDLVLANQPAHTDAGSEFQNTLLAAQPVSLVGRPLKREQKLRFPQDLAHTPLVLPARGSTLRSGFDALLGAANIHPIILAEIDDMAMLRLMARETSGLTLVPPVVVIDELNSGTLVERVRIPKLREEFYAITRKRKFRNVLVVEILNTKTLAKRLRVG